MKIMSMTGPKQVGFTEAEIPHPPHGHSVIVKLTYCGVCMSEHYAWSTAKPGATFGHEPVGVVAEVGKDVTKFKVGDRVSGMFAGNAQYVVSDDNRVLMVPDNVEDHQAILEPLSCLISAVSKARIEQIGQKVAVVGCGYMGCGAISLLKKRGCYVVGVDIREESLENAKRYGADEVYTPETLPPQYRDIPGTDLNFTCEEGRGFKLVMEWGETAEALDLAIHMTRQNGQLCIGAYHTGGKRLVDVQMLNVKAIDCLSTHPRDNYEFMYGNYANALKMLADDSWNYKHVPTKIYPYTRFDKAHEELETKFGKYLKAVIDWQHDDFEPYILDE